MKTLERANGSTLIEMLASLGVIVIAGIGYFLVLYTSITSSAKNDAVNLSHEEGREMINQMVRQMHNAVVLPTLVNTSLAAVTTSTAAGVIFETYSAGPGQVATLPVAAGATRITISLAAPYDPAGTPKWDAPAVGQRLLMPAFEYDGQISGVSGTSSPYTLTLSTPLTYGLTSTGSPNFQVYLTRQAALVVNNGILQYYYNTATSSPVPIARNVTTTTPFSAPSGSTNFVQMSLTTVEPLATGRGYKNVNFQATVTVPLRYIYETIQ